MSLCTFLLYYFYYNLLTQSLLWLDILGKAIIITIVSSRHYEQCKGHYFLLTVSSHQHFDGFQWLCQVLGCMLRSYLATLFWNMSPNFRLQNNDHQLVFQLTETQRTKKVHFLSSSLSEGGGRFIHGRVALLMMCKPAEDSSPKVIGQICWV